MPETPRRALVVEGGGMRGSYAAGALVALFSAHGARFDAVWATSSGAASSAYGLAGQPEGIEIWRRHLHGRRLVHPMRFMAGRQVLDLDYLVDEVFRRRVPLDVEALHASGTPLNVPVTDVADGTVRYFDLTASDPFPVLKAAMSLPGAVLDPVRIGGRAYIDGGVVDQIPIQEALSAGATDITVILTRPAAYTARPTGRFGRWLATRPFPGIAEALDERHVRYVEAMQHLTDPPAGVTMHVVRPTAALPVKRWTTKRRALWTAIDRGAADAAALLSAASATT